MSKEIAFTEELTYLLRKNYRLAAERNSQRLYVELVKWLLKKHKYSPVDYDFAIDSFDKLV